MRSSRYDLKGHLTTKEEFQKQIHDMALQIMDVYDICNPTNYHDFLTQSEMEDFLNMLCRFSGVITFDTRKHSSARNCECTDEYYYMIEGLIRVIYYNPDIYSIESYGEFIKSLNSNMMFLEVLRYGKPYGKGVYVQPYEDGSLQLYHHQGTMIHLNYETFRSIQNLIFDRLTPFQYQMPWQKTGNPCYIKLDPKIHIYNIETEEMKHMPFLLGFKELLKVVNLKIRRNQNE